MAAIFSKRGLWIAAVFSMLAVTFIISGTFIAAKRISSAAIKLELSAITGRRLVYSGEPVIHVFPAFTAELRDFSLHDLKNATDDHPVVKVAVVKLSLSALAALQNDVRITGMMLEQPVFHAKAQDGTWQLPFGDQARLSTLINSLTGSTPKKEYDKNVAEVQDNAIGKVIINNGKVVLGPLPNSIITDVEGEFTWLSGSHSGRFEATGVWREQPSSLNITTDDVAMLLAGADTGVGAEFSSDLLNSRFTGTVRLRPSPFIEGSIFAQANSLLKATRWQGLSAPFNFGTFGLTLSGELKGDLDKWQLEDSQLQLGANKGTGSLTFQPHVVTPLLSGTLDFESLDLAMLTQLFEPDPVAQQSDTPTIATDVRISASTASFGSLSLNKVAASLQSSREANALDIHNAAAFGGTLQMAVKRQSGAGGETELRILADDIETKALETLGGPFTGLPQSRGSLSAILRGPNTSGATFFERAEGTAKVRLGEGTIPGLNANQMVRALHKGGFFGLKAEAPSVFSFTELNATVALANGTLQFNPLRIGLDKAALLLTGAYAIKDDSIALTGTLDLQAAHSEAGSGAESLNVFFGGSRDAPLMSGLDGKP